MEILESQVTKFTIVKTWKARGDANRFINKYLKPYFASSPNSDYAASFLIRNGGKWINVESTQIFGKDEGWCICISSADYGKRKLRPIVNEVVKIIESNT